VLPLSFHHVRGAAADLRQFVVDDLFRSRAALPGCLERLVVGELPAAQATDRGPQLTRLARRIAAPPVRREQPDVPRFQRARLDLNKGDTVSRIENEQARLTLNDTEQKLQELEAKVTSDVTANEADLAGKKRKREKALFDLQRAERGIQNLQLRAPAAGMVNVLTNYRASGPWGGQEVEFHEGDRAWPGAAIMELPDLTSVHLEARLDEADRGRLKVGQEATIRIEAIPGREFKATIERISVLAKVDYSSGWPPARNFELGLLLAEIDPKIRPGMSAVARIATDRIPDVVLVPSESIFQHDGRPIVYKLDGSDFVEQPVQITRRGKESAIVESGVAPGEKVATRKPAAEMIRRKR